MPIVDFRTREDDRTMSRLRRRALTLPRSQRIAQRQAPPPPSPASSDDGFSSQSEGDDEKDDDDSDEEESKGKPKTRSSQTPSQSAAATLATPMPTPAPSTFITSAASVASKTVTEPRHQLSSSPTQISTKSSTTTTSFVLNPTAEAIQETDPPNQTRQHKSLSHDATIALEVIGIATGIALGLGLCFFLFKWWKKRKARMYLDKPTPPPAMRGGWNNAWKERFIPSGNGAPPVSGGYDGDNAVNRQERLGRVRTSLLGEKELSGGLMRGHSRNNSLNGNGDGVNTPTKAFLRKNSETGQMVMEKSGHLRSQSKDDTGRVKIEASGQWEDPVTVARRSEASQRRGSSGVGVGPGILPPIVFKPTAGAADEAGEYEGERYGWNADPYRMSELSTVRDGISPSERGSTIFSAWKGRERERERLRRDRDSRATTIAKWQSPMSWVKDQVERTDPGAGQNGTRQGQENRENKGMIRLPD